MDLSSFEYRTQSWFDAENFQGFSEAIPMKTMVLHCFDPRATEIPIAVAKYFGDEVYPGEVIIDDGLGRVGHTRTLFPLVNAGGRAVDALMAIATMDYIFRDTFKKVAVVHHSFCGATTLRPEQLIDRFRNQHHSDISDLFDRDSIAIHFDESVKHDLALLRKSPAVPKEMELFGFFYEMNSGELIEIARDIPVEE